MGELISVVIPAYNLGERLRETLESVSAQTYTHLEIIVVDDGSTDNTAAVLKEYAAIDNRVYPIFKENGGVTSARLCGISEAKGEWIGFVDGDDIVESTMFERLLKNAKQYGADISHCGYQMVFPDGHVDYYYNTGCVTEQDNEKGLRDLVCGEFVDPSLCNKLFRRNVIKQFLEDNPMDRTIRLTEDLLMNYYLFKLSEKSVHEDICPYHYVLRKGSAATSKLNEYKLKDPLRVLDILLEDSRGLSAVHSAVIQRRVYHMVNTATIAYGSQKELIKPYRGEVRRTLRREWWSVVTGTACNSKIKLMATWAVFWPWSYSAVHRLHAKLAGLDKKYNVE